MRICHFSDWHGNVRTLPEADAYFCTGDMYEDYWEQDCHGYRLDKNLSHKIQEEYLNSLGNLRDIYLPKTCRDAPVAIVRGNHCFTEYAHKFGGEVYNIGKEATSFVMSGLKIGGFRGTSFISPSFSDGLKDTHKVACKLVKDLDIVMTHAPPKFILDGVRVQEGTIAVGMPGLREYLEKCNEINSNLTLALFGHIHETFGVEELNNILCCNSATGYTLLDRLEDGSWEVVEAKSGLELF